MSFSVICQVKFCNESVLTIGQLAVITGTSSVSNKLTCKILLWEKNSICYLLNQLEIQKVLAQKQSFIDYVAKKLDEAGIEYERKGSTTLDVYNSVSRTRPIYVVRAQSDGVDLVDDSAARIATDNVLPGYDRDDVYDIKTVDSRNSYNKLLGVAGKNPGAFY